MTPTWKVSAALLIGAVFASGCQNTNLASVLREAGVGGSPDEFMVLPTRPLEIPQDLNTLPVPKPGSVSLVDYRPKESAVAALTGGPTAVGTASGAALVAAVPPASAGIRTVLANEDVTYRENNKGLFFQRMFTKDKEALIYSAELLNPKTEYNNLQAAGVRTYPATPSVLEEQRVLIQVPDPTISGYRPVYRAPIE